MAHLSIHLVLVCSGGQVERNLLSVNQKKIPFNIDNAKSSVKKYSFIIDFMLYSWLLMCLTVI